MFLWIIAIGLVITFVYFFMFRQQKRVKSLYTYQTLDDLVTAVSVHMRDRIYLQKRTVTSHEQMINAIADKQLVRTTLEKAIAGSYIARRAILDEIEAFLVGSAMNITSLDELSCILFRNPDSMTSNEKFETMMYFIQKEIIGHLSPEDVHDEDNQAHLLCFKEFARITGAFELKRALLSAPHLRGYYLNDEDLSQKFRLFIESQDIEIEVKDAVAITAVMIYQRLFGFGPIDTLVYDNSIDEIQMGTSGATVGSARNIVSPENSVMVSVSNKLLRLQFIHFDSPAAFKNSIIALAANGERTFTADDGYKFTTLLDLRRITARRPPLADQFSVNIRKLDAHVRTNAEMLLLNPVDIFGVDFVEQTLQLFAWSLSTIAWSGEQFSGKTTHINAFYDLLDADVAVRAAGNIDESHFGNRYPERDMQHYFVTPRQTLHEVAGVMRRTKGVYFGLMEILTAEDGQEAINNIQSGYVGGTLSTHGATPEAVIGFIAQLLAMGQATSADSTLKTVASAVNIVVKTAKYGDIYHFDGITEIIPRDWNIKWSEINPDNTGEFPDLDPEMIAKIAARNEQLYFKNSLDPLIFTTNRIVGFDKRTNKYFPENRPSPGYCARLFLRMPKEHRRFLFNYMEKWFNVDLAQELIDTNVIYVDNKDELAKWIS